MRKIYVTLFLSVMVTVSLMAHPLSAENKLTVRQQSIARIAYCTGKGDWENLKPAYAEFAPVIERFLKEHLFTDLFERDVLTYAERELATVSVIAALGESVEPMLRSHMGICRNLGMTEEQLAEVLAIAASYSKNEENNNK